MAWTPQDTMNPFTPDQVRAGGYITTSDLRGLYQALYAAMLSSQQVLAYSTGPSITIDEFWTPVYIFSIRVEEKESLQDRLRFWGTGVDVRLSELSVPGNSPTVIVSGLTTSTISSGEMLSATGFLQSATQEDGDGFLTLMLEARKKDANLSAIGQVFGFIVDRIGEDEHFGSTNHTSGVVPISDDRIDDGSVADVAVIRRLCLDIERLLQSKRRGCAIAYPVVSAPIMSSIHWRGHGPYPWLAAPWANEADVVMRVGNFVGSATLQENSLGYAGIVSVGAFSGTQRRDPREVEDIDTLLQSSGIGSAGMITTNQLGTQIKSVVPVRAGSWNDVFVAYRSHHFDELFYFENELTNTRFDEFPQGVIRSVVDGDFPTTVAEFLDAISWPAGKYIQLRPENSAWINTTGGGKPASSPAGITRGGSDPTADYYNVSFEYLFDITNYKGLHDGEYYNSISPSPPFIIPTAPGDENFKIAINRMGWTRLFSVWIGDRVRPSTAYQFARAGRPAPSSLVESHATLLNGYLDHPLTVYGIGNNNVGQFDWRGRNEASKGAIIGRGTTYPIFGSVGDLYFDVTDPVVFERALTCPLFLPRNPSGDRRRNPQEVLCRIEYFIVRVKDDANKSEDSGRIPQPAIRLRFRPRVWEAPPWHVAFGPGTFYDGDWYEADVKDLIRSTEDISTMSLWDDYVGCGKHGWSDSDPAEFGRSIQMGSWPAEILSEKYPYDVYEFSFPMELAYGDDGFLSLDIDFHSFQRLGSGASGTNSWGDGKYYLFIKGFSVVPGRYDRETR